MANRALPLHFTISNFDHSRTQKPLHFPCIVSTITKRTHLAEMFQDQRIDHLKRIVSRSRTLYQSVAGYVPTSDGLDRSLLGFDCDEVYPSLFIGDRSVLQLQLVLVANSHTVNFQNLFWFVHRRAATNRNYIEHLGVTHILNVAETPNCFRFQNALFYQDMRVSYMGISLEDNVDSQISQYFHVTANFIDTAIKNGGKFQITELFRGWKQVIHSTVLFR